MVNAARRFRRLLKKSGEPRHDRTALQALFFTFQRGAIRRLHAVQTPACRNRQSVLC